MADIKTHLRELSVAITVGLLSKKYDFCLNELYNSNKFMMYAKKIIGNDISSANNLLIRDNFSSELCQIINNGYNLGKKIYQSDQFDIDEFSIIQWKGNDTQKEDPVDIVIGKYGFSLKEESFILENMGLYKLLNCFTGSTYKKRHIFKDYALCEYKKWFSVTWNEMVKNSDVLPPLKKWGLPAQEYQRIQYQRANPVRPTVFTNDVPFVPWIFYAQKEAWFSHIRFLCATQYIQLSMY